MFRALPSGSIIEADPAQIVTFQRSLNSSSVALNGPMVQARAYIVGLHNEPRNTYSLFVSLRSFDRTGSVFCCDPQEVSLANFRDAEQAALELVEGHGFVMETIDLRQVPSVDEMRRYLNEVPIRLPEDTVLPMKRSSQGLPAVDEASGGVGQYIYTKPKSSTQSSLSNQSLPEGNKAKRSRSTDSRRTTSLFGGGAAPATTSTANTNRAHVSIETSSPDASGHTLQGPPNSVTSIGSIGSISNQTARSSTGMSVATDLGVPPEEAIAILGRLLAIF